MKSAIRDLLNANKVRRCERDMKTTREHSKRVHDMSKDGRARGESDGRSELAYLVGAAVILTLAIATICVASATLIPM